MNVLLSDPFSGLSGWFGVFLGLYLFMGPLPSPIEGKDAIVAHISGKIQRNTLIKNSPLLLFCDSRQGVDIKE